MKNTKIIYIITILLFVFLIISYNDIKNRAGVFNNESFAIYLQTEKGSDIYLQNNDSIIWPKEKYIFSNISKCTDKNENELNTENVEKTEENNESKE